MIEEVTGDLLHADAEALVNAVNCVGVMGKGIALHFKKTFPTNFEAYHQACRSGELRPGRMFVFEVTSHSRLRYIVNFPTKRHWRDPSCIEDVETGLRALVAEVERRGIRSIAVPPLGCGNGGLDWDIVKPLIERAFTAVPDVRVLLYSPRP